ncbi:hypothetical protein ASG90_20340 [Nocardioides sp. Soil797]|nr:hypothetical protein ASG90_20340 [Nocardioides sp. Soil797]
MRRLGVTLGCTLLVASGVTASASGSAAGSGTAPDDSFVSAGGQRVDGGELNRAARHSDLSEQAIEALLSEDPSARLDSGDRLKFVDHLESSPATDDAVVARASAPLAKTFRLHSRRASHHTIYLDFDGERVCGTVWDPYGCINAPRFDTNGRRGFSKSERRAIQRIWRGVVEDYAPFDVDITTERPQLDDLVRSDSSDTTFGIQTVITSSNGVRNRVCGGSRCAGAAYMGTFDSEFHNDGRVTWILPKEVRNNPRRIADAVSHEAGHTFGLSHDGTSRSGYYGGHGIWGPIMGASARPLTQWSRGQYSGANNKQNDVAIIARNGAPRLRDDHSGHRSGATFLAPGKARSGRITRASDVDMFKLRTTCRAPLTVKVRNAAQSPNLDVSLVLKRRNGKVVARRNPLSTAHGKAKGLDATYRGKRRAGVLFVRVDGVGARSPRRTGYSDYGSLGSYRVSFSSRCGAKRP